MKKNIGSTDRTIRFVGGAVIVLAGLILKSWWGLIGILPLTTAAISYCPLYALLGWSTIRAKDK